jgi:formamidopyrimidine-DNA glycosylase
VPELPEVETVRAGLAGHVLGRTVREVEVLRESAVRRHAGGAAEFAARLEGRVLASAVRRGKFCWLLLDAPGEGGECAEGALLDAPADGAEGALTFHLGMSGQMLVGSPDAEPHRHLRVRLHLTGSDGETLLDFVDQRTFGHLSVCRLLPTADGAPGGHGSDLAAVPDPVAHIARDLLDPNLDRAALVAAVRRRRTGIKRALLDQTLVSGIGNIYADEALWRARVHGATPTLRMRRVPEVLDSAEQVMREALAAGGTSFDALYVNVNGASGFFDRSLAVYGQAGRLCSRCGALVVREPFMNRSSYRCPRCQPAPPTVRGSAAVSSEPTRVP